MKRHLATLALGAFFVPAAILVGCGDSGMPGNAVAEVDGAAIEKRDFEHWLAVAAKTSGQPNAAVPKPPEFADCVAQARKATAKPAEGQPKPTDAQLKAQCKQQYDQLREQVLGLLISFEWIEREASDQGVTVTDAEVKKSFEDQKKQTFPKPADYAKFLKDSGQTDADVQMRVRLDALSNKIRDKVTRGKDRVSDAALADYFEKNQAQFSQPERRDLSIVLTKTEAKAREAKAALDGGQAFRAVAKRYSIDDASKAQGGKLPAVAEGQQEKAFDSAIFKAPRGKITGPVKTQFGYYVFRVDKVTRASKQSLEQARPTIKQVLVSQSQQKALDAFVKDFRARWKAKTDCREGYVTQDCKNAPKPTPTPTPAAVQQAPDQQPAPAASPPRHHKPDRMLVMPARVRLVLVGVSALAAAAGITALIAARVNDATGDQAPARAKFAGGLMPDGVPVPTSRSGIRISADPTTDTPLLTRGGLGPRPTVPGRATDAWTRARFVLGSATDLASLYKGFFVQPQSARPGSTMRASS